MKPTQPILAFLINAAIAAPNPVTQTNDPENPALQCPEGWYFGLKSFNGPGCPDFDPKYNRTGYSITSQGWGSHFIAGQCDTQWAWYQFPWLQASIGPGVPESKKQTWCEFQVDYHEATDYGDEIKKKDSKWKLRMHKNGTSMEAEYGLDEGVTADWKVTYSPPNGTIAEKRVDEISINGPVWNDTKPTTRLDWSTTKKPIRHVMPECGPAIFGVRIDLALSSIDANAKGTVVSKQAWDVWLGAIHGLSFDWEPCRPV